MAAVVTALILAGAADAASTATLTQAESSLLTAMNEVRLANGVQPLRADTRLERAARAHSSKMLRTGTFYHGAFNARIRRTGVHAPRVGENLAWGQGELGSPLQTLQLWLNSPPHRKNLLARRWRDLGIAFERGHMFGYDGVALWVMQFGRRR